jgi:hypothetical protein
MKHFIIIPLGSFFLHSLSCLDRPSDDTAAACVEWRLVIVLDESIMLASAAEGSDAAATGASDDVDAAESTNDTLDAEWKDDVVTRGAEEKK